MQHTLDRRQKGFTLVELLLYVAVSSTLLLVTSLFLQTLLESRIKNQTITEVEQQGLQIIQAITQTLRNADSVSAPGQGTSAASLTLATYTPGLNPTVFDLSGGTIRVKEGAAAAIPLTNARVTASSLLFSNLSRTGTPGVVRIQFTLSHVNPSGRNEYAYSRSFVVSASLRHP
jgi:Tfp pilus assembly protein PilW